MATEAFYKLDEHKREKLLTAARHEFSSLPYEKVSVFKIAQNAGISRSGFYYYFKDKQDIYDYLIIELKDEFLEISNTDLSNIELFDFFREIFDFIASIKGSKHEKLVKQIVLNIKQEDTKLIFKQIEASNKKRCVNIDSSNLNVSDDNERRGLIVLLITAIMYSLCGYLEDRESLDDANMKLEWMFSTIKKGVVREEDNI